MSNAPKELIYIGAVLGFLIGAAFPGLTLIEFVLIAIMGIGLAEGYYRWNPPVDSELRAKSEADDG